MFKAGIVGCGAIAGKYDEDSRDDGVYSHAGAYRKRSSQIILSACAEIDQQRRQVFQQTWNVPKGFGTLAEMLESVDDLDMISVCTPDLNHAGSLLEILKKGRTRIIWTEKPLASSAESGRQVLAVARQTRVSLRLSNQRRWEPAHQQLALDLRAGIIGTITGVNGFYVKGITHIGTTMVNTLRFLIGEIVGVQALEPYHKGSYPGDPSLSAVIWFHGGVTGTVRGIDRDSYRYSIFEIDIVGTDGRVRITDNGDRIAIEAPAPYPHYSGFAELESSRIIPTQMSQSLLKGLDSMLEELNSGAGPNIAEAEEGLRDLEIVGAIISSANQGGARQMTL